MSDLSYKILSTILVSLGISLIIIILAVAITELEIKDKLYQVSIIKDESGRCYAIAGNSRFINTESNIIAVSCKSDNE